MILRFFVIVPPVAVGLKLLQPDLFQRLQIAAVIITLALPGLQPVHHLEGKIRFAVLLEILLQGLAHMQASPELKQVPVEDGVEVLAAFQEYLAVGQVGDFVNAHGLDGLLVLAPDLFFVDHLFTSVVGSVYADPELMFPELFSYPLISLAFQYLSVKHYIVCCSPLRDRNKIAAAHLFSGLRVTIILVQLTGACHVHYTQQADSFFFDSTCL